MTGEHRKIFIFLLGLLFMGLTLGTVPTSIPQFLLAGYWLLTGSFYQKWQNLRKYPECMAWMFLWIWHLIGMAWTEDTYTGWNDVRIKLPMFLIPLFLCSFSPPDANELKKIMFFFIIGLLINVIWCHFWMWRHQPMDLRDASRFMSHIRLGYLLVTGLIILGTFLIKEKKHIFLMVMLMGYLLFSIWQLGLFSAFLGGMVVLMVIIVRTIFFRSTLLMRRMAWVFVFFIMAAAGYVFWFYDSFFMEKKDHPYNRKINIEKFVHFPEMHLIENGYRADINVNREELIRNWNRRFPEHPLHEYSSLFYGLIRYMASLGLTKDSLGFSQLKDTDLQNILDGLGNVRYAGLSGINKKLYENLYSIHQWQKRSYRTTSSLSMRIYYWSVGMEILRKNVWGGCGTGDVFSEMKKSYLRDGIENTWMKRPHQQFLSIWIALGITGLFLFIYVWVTTFRVLSSHPSLPFLLITFLMLFSFLYEDTLETQTGVSYVVFFHVLGIWYLKNTTNRKKEGG